MKIAYFYFSGTGHTKYLVEKTCNLFNQRGILTTVCDCTDISQKNWEKINANDYDIIGLSYPIHAFSTPKNFDIFVRQLNVKNKPFFVLKNSREALSINDSSSRRIVRFMKKKGCELLQEKHLLLPYNIHFRHDDRLVKQMLLTIEERLPIFVDQIITMEKKELKFRIIPTMICNLIGKTLWGGAKLIGNSFYVLDNCTSCAKCQKNCPQHNISLKEKDGKMLPYFKGNKCILCMRCVYNCPKDAIRIKKYLKGWEVCGSYEFEKILNDTTIKGDYITKDYNGKMAKSYKKYFLGD